MSKPKWDQTQIKEAVRFLREAVECIKCEAPLSFKEALDQAESLIQQARQEADRYTDACLAVGQVDATPEALYYRRNGKFPPKKKNKEED